MATLKGDRTTVLIVGDEALPVDLVLDIDKWWNDIDMSRPQVKLPKSHRIKCKKCGDEFELAAMMGQSHQCSCGYYIYNDPADRTFVFLDGEPQKYPQNIIEILKTTCHA